jgi:peptide/nickel transport system substrate-binding protein
MFLVFFILNSRGLPSADPVINWGSALKPETMDPALAWDDTSVFFAANIFETLVRLNPETLEIEPSLAVSWEAKKQGKMWVFKLRENVKFHDHTDFNAQAVVFSFQRHLDKNFQHRYSDFFPFEEIFSKIKSVTAAGSHTVVFHLHDRFFPFLSILSSSGAAIISPTAVQKYKSEFSKNPVGTGPYMLKSWGNADWIVLKAYPEYWRGKARIEEVVFKMIPNYDLLHKLFRQGEIDIFDTVSISRTIGLRNVQWVTIRRVPLLSVFFIAFNFENEYLRNGDIRSAIKYAWDERTLKYVFQDFVVPINSIIPRGIPGYREILPRKEFSLSKSKMLLAKDKARTKIRFAFLLREATSLERRLLQLFSRNLKQAGIELDVQSLSQEEYVRRIQEGDFDLTISGWIADYPDAHNILYALFNDQFPKSGFANLSGYKDKKLRKSLNRIATEGDVLTRNNRIETIVRMIDEQTLCIPVWQETYVLIFNNRRIQKVGVSPHGNVALFDIEIK